MARLTQTAVYSCLKQVFPSQNDYHECDYLEELGELNEFGISTEDALITVLLRHRNAVLEIDRSPLNDQEVKWYSEELGEETVEERIRLGYWFAYPALLRLSLEIEFGDAYRAFADRRDGISR